MSALRIIVTVVAGYLAYTGGSMLLVGPIATGDGPLLVVLGLLGLAALGLLVGLIAGKISAEHGRTAIYLLAGLVVVVTLANLVLRLGTEPAWYKIGTLVLTVPLILRAGSRASRP